MKLPLLRTFSRSSVAPAGPADLRCALGGIARCALAATVLGSVCAPLAAAQAVAAPERAVARLDLVPADALVVGWADDVRALRSNAAGNELLRLLLAEPALARALDLDLEFDRDLFRLLDSETAAEKREGMDAESRMQLELLDLVSGGASGYVRLYEETWDSVGVALFEVERSVPQVVELLQRYWSATEIDGLEFTNRGELLIGFTEADQREPWENSWGIVLGDGTLAVVGASDTDLFTAELERIALLLGRAEGDPEPSLADSELLRDARANLRLTGGQVHGLVNLEWPMDWLRRTLEGEGSFTVFDEESTAARFIRHSGLLDMRWLVGTFEIGTGERVEFEAQAHVPAGSLLALAADQCGPLPLDLLGRLPADAVSLLGVNYDIAGLFAGMFSALEELEMSLAEMLEAQLAFASEMAGVELEADFMAQLTGRMVRVVDSLERVSEDVAEESLQHFELPATWACEVRDPEIVEGSVEDLGYRVAPGADPTDIELGGRRVWEPVDGFLRRYWLAAGPIGGGFLALGSSGERLVQVVDSLLAPAPEESPAAALHAVLREFGNASLVHTGRTADLALGGLQLWNNRGSYGFGAAEPVTPEILEAVERLRSVFVQLVDRTPSSMAYRMRVQ